MKQTDFLIVGQGIAGVLTAFALMQKGKSVVVFDKDVPGNASKMAGALLNPVNLNTGKVFPHQQNDFEKAIDTYQNLAAFLNISFLEKCPLFAFSDKLQENIRLRPCTTVQLAELARYFHNPANAFYVEDAFHVRFDRLKPAWRAYLASNNQWKEVWFDYQELKINPDNFVYGDMMARHIIFCEGATGQHNPFFPNQPFTRNLGNILHIDIEGLNPHAGYHFAHQKLIPLGGQKFWMGSNYVWDFTKPEPNPIWRAEQTALLKKQLRLPFRITNHFVAERPTTAGQQPLLRMHPEINNFYFFNGLGTRGFSTGAACVEDLMAFMAL